MQGPRHFARLTVKIQLDVGVQEDGDHGEEEHLQLWSPARKWWMVVHLALSWSCHAARISWEVETTGKVYLLHIWTKCVNTPPSAKQALELQSNSAVFSVLDWVVRRSGRCRARSGSR